MRASSFDRNFVLSPMVAKTPRSETMRASMQPVDAAFIKARSVASIRSILKNGLDRAFLDETPDHQPLHHGNIRGQGYFH